MSAIPVLFVCRYLTEVEGLTWRPVDFTSLKIVKAIKGEPLNKYVEISIGGKNRRFYQSDVDALVSTVTTTIGSKLREVLGSGRVSIVPIPNSGAVVGAPGESRTDMLAKHVAAGFGGGTIVEPLIRWKTARTPQHKGSGFRDPDAFQDQMVLLGKPKHPVVLFDDVMTSGAQLTAAARTLEEAGHTPIHAAVVGRVTKTQEETMLGWITEELEIGRAPLFF
jgi:hypothetical protein